jgi:5-methylcytosine-specific restriction endonuclease McrA
MPSGVYPRNEMHREICRKAGLGRIPWNKGYKYPDGKKPCPPHPKGKDHPRYGKKHTEESKIKMSEALKKFNPLRKKRTFPDNYAQLMRECLGKGKYVKCLNCNILFYAKDRDLRRGRRYCSRICGGHSISKEKNPRWNGGTTKPNRKIRGSLEYKRWRFSVFQRDDFKCTECNKKGKTLQAHHIKPFSLFPELRLDLNNGITLCLSCHKKTDSYLRRIDLERG